MPQEPQTSDIFKIALNSANVAFREPYLYDLALDMATLCLNEEEPNLMDLSVILAKYGSDIKEVEARKEKPESNAAEILGDMVKERDAKIRTLEEVLENNYKVLKEREKEIIERSEEMDKLKFVIQDKNDQIAYLKQKESNATENG